MGPVVYQSAPLPWIVVGSLGYTAYQNILDCDSQTVLGRFAIAKELFGTPYSNFGLELGVQSGNTMHLDVSEATLDELGGLPIQSTMKPMVDLLATAKITPTNSPFFALLKGGIAYRHWQFDGRNSVNNLSKFSGEVQAGAGYSIGSLASLSLLYQGVFGGNPNFTVSEVCPSGRVSRIPTQQGVLLSFSFNFFG
jgi:hypothetical protein